MFYFSSFRMGPRCLYPNLRVKILIDTIHYFIFRSQLQLQFWKASCSCEHEFSFILRHYTVRIYLYVINFLGSFVFSTFTNILSFPREEGGNNFQILFFLFLRKYDSIHNIGVSETSLNVLGAEKFLSETYISTESEFF